MQLVAMTPLLPSYAASDKGMRGVVGPVVLEGSASAAVQNDVAFRLRVTGGDGGLLFDYTNVTVWCGTDSMQTAGLRQRARFAFVRQGPVQAGQARLAGPPDFATSGIQPGSMQASDFSEQMSGKVSTKLVLALSMGACCGTNPG
jgi:hypothetical protein